ncbi:MAG TPA: class I SAM-dependent methyltransferase [Egibacteraceae bacterium]|nr:class I SAM-dependent methyltransferase [Egibacteraceae bacterium]
MDERIASTVAAYDEAAEAYQEQMSERRPLDAVRKFAGMAGRGARVLDVACGPVLDVRALRDAGLKVVAGDRSHESMRIGKILFPKGALARWDFRRLPFADDTFGGVWAHAALQHLPRAQMRAGLAELRRVQASGPIFVGFREGSDDLEPVEDPPAGTVYVTTVSADELRALLLDAGYVEVEVDVRPDLNGRPASWLYGFGRLRT